jgi:hypothetical protein
VETLLEMGVKHGGRQIPRNIERSSFAAITESAKPFSESLANTIPTQPFQSP